MTPRESDETNATNGSDALARVAELEAKLKGAVKKGKALERDNEKLRRELEDARSSDARTRDAVEASVAVGVDASVTVLRAELESFRAENATLRERLERAEASEDDEDDGDASDGSEGGDAEDSLTGASSERPASKMARMRLRIARHADARAALERALADVRAEAEATKAAANAERVASERARRAADEERELAAQARARAENAHAESANARAEAEARVATLESELERLGEEWQRSEGRLQHLTRVFDAKQEEYESKLASVKEARIDGADGADSALERERALANELKQAREALRDTQRELDRARASDAAATESALAARASESVWKERAQAALASAAAAKEAYESRVNHAAADGGDAVADLAAAEQRAKEAETALAEARQELAAFAAAHANGTSTPKDASVSALARRLAESEALVLKKNEEISSLTRRFTDLAWRTTVEKRATGSEGVATVADGLAPLAYRRPLNRRLETVLRHRRFLIGSYLVLLHLLAYEYLFAAS